jgi:hypothetical protein
MAMKLLPANDQLVSHFMTDGKQDDLITFHIVQHTQVTRPKLELGKRIGS